jgi:MFS family permease
MLIISVGWGAPYLIAVALKPMAADLGSARSVPSLASSLAYIGIGVGGIFMGWWADRVGAMWTALVGSIMIGAGAMVASGGAEWQLYIGYGVMIGLFGGAGLFAPLMTNTSRWFDTKRGTALAIVASGQQIAERLAAGVPLAPSIDGLLHLCSGTARRCACYRRSLSAPVRRYGGDRARSRRGDAAVPGIRLNLVQAVTGLAIVLLRANGRPQHLVAFCGDPAYAPRAARRC